MKQGKAFSATKLAKSHENIAASTHPHPQWAETADTSDNFRVLSWFSWQKRF